MVGHFDLIDKNRDHQFAIHQGFAYSVRFTFPSDIDLTGYTGAAQMRPGPSSSFLYFDVEPTIDQDEDSLWFVQLDLTDSETAAIPATRQGFWALALSTGGVTDLGFEGTAECKPGVIA